MNHPENLKKFAQELADEYNKPVFITEGGSYFLEHLRKENDYLPIEEWVYPNTLVGYLINTALGITFDSNTQFKEDEELDFRQEFWCPKCHHPVDKTILPMESAIPVYRVNIGIYSQVCDSCGTLVVDGVKSSGSPNKPLCLFGKVSK